jgi:hypothetical protein
MNPLISISEFSKLDRNSVNLIFCVKTGEAVKEYIENSLLFFVDDSTSDFIAKARGMELDEEKGVVVYDKGELNISCRVFWGLRATGHDDVRVLVGGLKVCETSEVDLITGTPKLLDLTEPFLPFNTAVIIPYTDFVKKESYYQQVTYAEKVNFNIIDSHGGIINQQEMIKNLESAEIAVSLNKATMVHGPAAEIIAILLKYLGQRSVSIVIDNTEGFISAKKYRKSTTHKETDPGPASNTRTAPVANIENSKPKVIEEQSKCTCNCVIY